MNRVDKARNNGINTTMKYLNPYIFSNNKERCSPADTWAEPTRQMVNHRGVSVFQRFSTCFDYVIDNVCICQRAGFNKERAKGIIDDFLDSTTKHTNTTYHAFERMQEAHKEGLELIAAGK